MTSYQACYVIHRKTTIMWERGHKILFILFFIGSFLVYYFSSNPGLILYFHSPNWVRLPRYFRGKESACQLQKCRRRGLISGSGRSLGKWTVNSWYSMELQRVKIWLSTQREIVSTLAVSVCIPKNFVNRIYYTGYPEQLSLNNNIGNNYISYHFINTYLQLWYCTNTFYMYKFTYFPQQML